VWCPACWRRERCYFLAGALVFAAPFVCSTFFFRSLALPLIFSAWPNAQAKLVMHATTMRSVLKFFIRIRANARRDYRTRQWSCDVTPQFSLSRMR
jgi:hypothetical protein